MTALSALPTHTPTFMDVASVTTSGTVLTVAHGWAHAMTSVTMAVLAQPLQIASVVFQMQLKTSVEPVYVMMDSAVKVVLSG